MAEAVVELDALANQVFADAEDAPPGVGAVVGRVEDKGGALAEKFVDGVWLDRWAVEVVLVVGELFGEVAEQGSAVVAQAGVVVEEAFGVEAQEDGRIVDFVDVD